MPFLSSCTAEQGHQPGADFGAPITSHDPDTLVSLIASVNTPEDSRKKADQLLVQIKGAKDPTRLSVLEQLLYAPAQQPDMRIYAMDQLSQADPARAGRTLVLYLPRFDDQVLDHACTLAASLGDVRLIEALARSLDRAAVEGENLHTRPEWAAIQKLGNKPPEETFWSLVSESSATEPRVAALDCLQLTTDKLSLLKRLAALPAHDAWLTDVQWWAASFGTLPVGGTECAWVQVLHQPDNAAMVSRALERHRLLASQPDYIAAPRFVHVLAYADDAAVRASRAELLAQIKARLDSLQHVRRVPASTGGPDDTDESLATHEKELSRGDLLAIHLLLQALQKPAILAEFQRQGLADMTDTTTEHGGLLAFQNVADPTLYATPFPPLYADNDFDYVSDDKLIQQAPTGIALYHYHFQQVRNQERAGPGVGDLKFAHQMRCNCVVITSIDTRAMDVDFYTPAGAVVDLGVYHVGD